MATVMKKKYRTFARDGYWSDPLVDYAKSTTYHFDNNSHESDTQKAMVTGIKKAKYKFKESDLSEETIQKFKDEKIDNKVGKEPKDDKIKSAK